ncbi:MAG: adenylate kinase [Bacteroidota bacterium]|jgi:adenylate kinase
MINLVLFGPPGAGKGTQSERLVSKYELIHLSTGDIFRKNMKNQTELGMLAKSYMDKGNLVPDSVTIDMLKSELEQYPLANGFIFDGFPRTSPQAEALDVMLEHKNQKITCMLALEVEEAELEKRLLGRAATSGRADDGDIEIVRNRIAVYNKETAPVADFYKSQNKYIAIPGIGEIDTISERLFQAIDSCL